MDAHNRALPPAFPTPCTSHRSPLHHAIKVEHRNSGWAYIQTQCNAKLIPPPPAQPLTGIKTTL